MNPIENLICESRLVPVFNHADADTGCGVVQACYDAGLRVFEWTNRGEEAAGLFRVIRDYVDRHCPGMALGAGSIFEGPTCRKFHGMGADFIVSPILDPEMASVYGFRDAERSQRSIRPRNGVPGSSKYFRAMRSGVPDLSKPSGARCPGPA